MKISSYAQSFGHLGGRLPGRWHASTTFAKLSSYSPGTASNRLPLCPGVLSAVLALFAESLTEVYHTFNIRGPEYSMCAVRLNDKVDRNEVRWQLEQMREAGLDGIFLQPESLSGSAGGKIDANPNYVVRTIEQRATTTYEGKNAPLYGGGDLPWMLPGGLLGPVTIRGYQQ